ncbi:MAG: DUF397 domain-containing protein [Micromonosporaceae bacterium]
MTQSSDEIIAKLTSLLEKIASLLGPMWIRVTSPWPFATTATSYSFPRAVNSQDQPHRGWSACLQPLREPASLHVSATSQKAQVYGMEPSGDAGRHGLHSATDDSDEREGGVEITVTEDAAAVSAHKADAGRLILMRDSNNPDGPVLAFTEDEWRAFIAGVKDGEFDDLG